MHRIILPSLACPAVAYFTILSHKSSEKLLNVKCLFWFYLQLLSETFLILRRTERHIINVCWSSCKVPVIPVMFQWNLNLLYTFSKNTQISSFMKIRPVGPSCSMRKDGTDRHDEANSCLSQFLRTRLKYIYIYIYIFFFFAVALRPNAGHGLLIIEVSRSHTTTHHSR